MGAEELPLSFRFLNVHPMNHHQIRSTFSVCNLWANQKLAGLFTCLDEAAANKTIVNSFPSVKRTFLHIWDAGLIWLNRLRGLYLTGFPVENIKVVLTKC